MAVACFLSNWMASRRAQGGRQVHKYRPHKNPLAMTQDSAGTDYQVIDPRGDSIDIRGADEDTEWIIILWHTPRAAACLGQVYLAAPSGHDYVAVCPAHSREAHSFPKRYGSRQVVARHDSEGTNSRDVRHHTYSASGLRQAQRSFKRRLALFAIEAARVLDVAAAFVGCNLRIGTKRPRAVRPRHVRRLARFRGDHVGRDTLLDPGI